MSRRLFHARALSLVLALAASAAAGRAVEAGQVPSLPSGIPPVHVRTAASTALAQDENQFAARGVDAEAAFRSEPPTSRSAPAVSLATQGPALAPIASGGELDTAPFGELRGKLLYRVMEDLPQVGSAAQSSPLQLDFWDDASSARSTIDERAIGRAELTSGGTSRLAGHSNVMIPLPAAVWSALSVLGGIGFFAGIRRVVRQFQ